MLKAGNSGRFHSEVLKCTVTFIAVAAAVIIAKVLQSHFKSEAFGSLFFCAIMFSGWFGGYRQGLLAATLSVLAFDYFFLAPIHSMAVSLNEVPRLIIFLLCALLVGFLSASQRNNTVSLRRARDELAEKLEALKKVNAFLDVENARRKQAEAGLQHSQAYLAEAQRLSQTGSFGWRVATGDLTWSAETFRIFQLDPKTKPTLEFVLQRVHPDDATLVQETIGHASRSGKDFDFVHRLLMPDGSVKHVHVVAHAGSDRPGGLEFVGAVMDITAANAAEDKICLIINTVPGLLWTARPDGWVDFLNQRWLDYTGMTLDQGLGWAWQPGYHPDDLGNVLSRWRAAVAERKPLEVEARLRRFDGEYRWFLKRAFPLFDNAGHVLGWYGGNIDVHDLKQAEAKLRRIENYLSEGQRLSRTGSWAWSVKTRENLFWSRESYRIFGFDPDTESGRYGPAHDRIHPADRRIFDEALEQAIQEQKDFVIDYRILLPGGEVKHVHNLGHPVLNTAGELIEYIGTTMDVTERKNAEREAQAHLWFLESMDRINRAIQGTNDLEAMMSEVLKAALAIFNCYRAWLIHPCDPQAPTWRAVMEHVRPGFPGAFALGVDLPLDPEVAVVFGRVRGSRSSVCFGPEADEPVPSQLAARFSIRSQIGLAIYPKLAQPYMLGLHQCTHSRVWTPPEQRLFQEIGRRMEDALSALLMFRNLQNSEARLAEAQRIAHVGHWERDLDTERVAWSDETYRIYGLAPQERVLYLAQVANLVHPEDRQMMLQAVADAVNGVRPYNSEFRVIRPGGEIRFVHSRGGIVKDESGRPRRHFGTIQDITERKLAEAALQARERELRLIAESIPGMIVVNSPDGANEYTTQRLLNYLGKELGDLKGLKWVSILHPEDADAMVDKWLDSVKTGRPLEVSHRMRRADGVYRWFQSRVEPLFNEQGRILRWYGLIIDMDDQVNAAEALRKSQADLAHISRLTTMGELTASIAHEVNQPLTAVVNNANASISLLLKGTPKLEEVREALTEIIEDANRASDVIARIRQLAKRAPVEKSLLDLRDVVQDVLDLARYESSVRQVTICAELSKDLPSVSGDRVQLQQVLLNLVINGMDAMSQVGESKRVLTIFGRRENRAGTFEARLGVRDSGVGFKPEEMDRLFEAFYTTKPQGLGMGLAISRSIIEAHGGRLWAEPNPGPGATFLLSLPAAGRQTV